MRRPLIALRRPPIMLSVLFEKLQGRTLLRKLIGNTFWQLGDKLLRMFVGLVVGIWVARYLGPVDFGLLNFASAFVALFTPLADLGLQAVVVRELVRRREDRARILASSLVLRSIGSAIAIALSAACIGMLRPGNATSQLVVLVIALSLFPQAWDVIDYDHQARMNPRPIVIVRGISLLIFSLAKGALILNDAGLIWFACTATGEIALSAMIMWALSGSEQPRIRVSDAQRSEMKYLLSTCWPLAISSLSVMLYMRIDQIMLGQMLDDHAVGIFSAAVRVSEVWYFVPLAIIGSVTPALTMAHKSSDVEYQRKLSLVIRSVCWLAIVVAIIFTLSAKPLIALLYGAGYAAASDVLAIHAWTGLFACLGVSAAPWFVNAGMFKFRMIHTIIGALVNVAMNLYMIPRFGVEGAAVSTLVSNSLAAFFLNALSSHTRPIFLLQARSLLMR